MISQCSSSCYWLFPSRIRFWPPHFRITVAQRNISLVMAAFLRLETAQSPADRRLFFPSGYVLVFSRFWVGFLRCGLVTRRFFLSLNSVGTYWVREISVLDNDRYFCSILHLKKIWQVVLLVNNNCRKKNYIKK